MPPDEVPYAAHPDTLTVLRCGRCETPICPRCLVHSPVGARCRACAPPMRAPMYVLTTSHVLRAFGAAIVGGAVMGAIWTLVLLPFTVGFLAIFVGAALGWAFTRLVDLATGGKRGPITVAAALLGIGLAWGEFTWFVGVRVGLYALVAVAIAAYFAYQSLR